MTTSFIFSFAPLPLTSELSPLAHAAALVRRRQAENQPGMTIRHRIEPHVDKKSQESVLN